MIWNDTFPLFYQYIDFLCLLCRCRANAVYFPCLLHGLLSAIIEAKLILTWNPLAFSGGADPITSYNPAGCRQCRCLGQCLFRPKIFHPFPTVADAAAFDDPRSGELFHSTGSRSFSSGRIVNSPLWRQMDIFRKYDSVPYSMSSLGYRPF